MRPSIYLIDRASSVLTAIRFFRTSQSRNPNDNLLIFLAQLPFWDFEVESLIYLFESFAERKEDWDGDSVKNKILKQNIIVKNKYLSDFYYRSLSVRKYNPYRWDKGGVTAPVEMLKEVVEEWNRLIEQCEFLLIDNKDAKGYELSGVSIQKNLMHFKKEIPKIVIETLGEDV
jgi:hypothetical protein